MQGVARQWRRVLGMREAHLEEIIWQDARLPHDVHILQGGRTRISLRFLGAILACKVPGETSTLAWLPPQLQVLDLGCCSAIHAERNCPVLLSLRKLKFSVLNPHALPIASNHFPNLEEIDCLFSDDSFSLLSEDWKKEGQGKEAFLSDIQNLANLRHIKFSDSRDVDPGEKVFVEEISGVANCRVDYRLVLCEGDLDFSEFVIPPGLATQLQSFMFIESEGADVEKSDALSLSCFFNCEALQKITYDTTEPKKGLAFVDFDRLPKVCKTVEICWDCDVEDFDDDSAVPLVQPTEGWQITLFRSDRKIIVRRVQPS